MIRLTEESSDVDPSIQTHHSFAVFHDNEPGAVSISGVVMEFKFTNPHGIIRMIARDEDGALQEWKAETNSPSILEGRDWKEDSLKAGDVISHEGWRARDGSNYMRMRKVTRANGTPVGVPFEFSEAR